MKSSRSRLDATAVTETAVAGGELGEDTLFPADSSEALQGLLDLLGRVSGDATRAEDGLAHRDCGVNHGVRVDAVFDQRFPEHHSAVLVAHVHRHDRCLRTADIQAHVAQTLPPLRRELVEAVDHLGFALEYIEGG